MNRLVIFGGTSEGRQLAEELAAPGAELLVSVATAYGAALLPPLPGVTVRAGRLEAPAMAALLRGAALCIDATHPYAVQASANIRRAAAQAGVPYRRLARPASPLPENAVAVPDAAAAAARLAVVPGNLLLATGAKELPCFAALDPQRLFPRVLPAAESIAACTALGIPRANIIAMQGPFSVELELSILHQFSIRAVVTKDGGAAGGFAAKAQAAGLAGALLLVIKRPPETGESYDEILRLCREVLTCR